MRRLSDLIAIAAIAVSIIYIVQQLDINKVGGMTVITYGNRAALLVAPLSATLAPQCLPPIRTE